MRQVLGGHHRVAARRVTLVQHARGGGHQHRDRPRLHRQLLSRALKERGFNTLPQLRLAGIDGDRARLIDADPGIEIRVHLHIAEGRAFRRRWSALREPSPAEHREANDQAAPGQKAAPRQGGFHHFGHALFHLPRLQLARPAARRIALMMRICVPHRQRFGCIQSRICWSVGDRFCRSNAWLRIIMPGMQ